MCEYCDLKNYECHQIGKHPWLQNEVASYLTISYYPYEHGWEISSFDGSIEIHYCPFCGGKLNNSEPTQIISVWDNHTTYEDDIETIVSSTTIRRNNEKN